MRRNTMSVGSMREKMNFFHKVHNVINHNSSYVNNNRGSQVNPIILKNYYDYTMMNELKHRKSKSKENKGSDRKKSKNFEENQQNPTMSPTFKIINYNITNISVHLPPETLTPSNILVRRNSKLNYDTRVPTNDMAKLSAKNFKSIIEEKDEDYELENYNINNKSILNKERERDNSRSRSSHHSNSVSKKNITSHEISNSDHHSKSKSYSQSKIYVCDCQATTLGNNMNIRPNKILAQQSNKPQQRKNSIVNKFLPSRRFSLLSKDILAKVNLETAVEKDLVNTQELNLRPRKSVLNFLPSNLLFFDKRKISVNQNNNNNEVNNQNSQLSRNNLNLNLGSNSNSINSNSINQVTSPYVQHNILMSSLNSPKEIGNNNINYQVNPANTVTINSSLNHNQTIMTSLPPHRRCEHCGGLAINNPILNDSITTYLNESDEDGETNRFSFMSMDPRSKRSSSKEVNLEKSGNNIVNYLTLANTNTNKFGANANPRFFNKKQFGSQISEKSFDINMSPHDPEQFSTLNPQMNNNLHSSRKKVNINEGKNLITEYSVNSVTENINIVNTNFNKDNEFLNFIKILPNIKKEETISAKISKRNTASNIHSNTNSSKKLLKRPTLQEIEKYNNKIKHQMPFKLKILDEFKNLNLKEYPRLAVSLSKMTTIRLVMLILLILFTLPYLDYDKYMDPEEINNYNFELNLFDTWLNHNPNDTSFFVSKVNQMILNSTYITLQTPDIISFGFKNRSSMCNYAKLCEIFESEKIYFDLEKFNMTRSDDKILFEQNDLFLVYSINHENKIEALLQICKIIFVSTLLFLGSFIFLKDSNKFVVLPLEDTFERIKEIKFRQDNFFLDLYQEDILNKFSKDENRITLNHKPSTKSFPAQLHNEEINMIRNNYIKMSKLIINVFGLRVFNYLESKIMNEEQNLGSGSFVEYDTYKEEKKSVAIEHPPFFKVNAVILCLEVTNLDQLCVEFGEYITKIFSHIIEICDLTSFEYFGEIFKIEGNKIFMLWDQGKVYSTKKKQLNRSSGSNDSNESNGSTGSLKSDNSQLTEKTDHSESYNINDEYSSRKNSISPERKFSEILVSDQVRNLFNSSLNESDVNDEDMKQIEKYLFYNLEKKKREEEKYKIRVLPELKNVNFLNKNSSNFALITAIKIFSRINHDEFLKSQLSKNKDNIINDLTLDLKLSLTKGSVFNYITNSDCRIESVYSGDSLKQATYINKLNTYKLNILFTEKIFKELDLNLRKFSRNVSVIKRGKDNDEKFLKLYAFDIDFNKPQSKNPYISDNLKIEKEHSLIVRKTFIELMNTGKFEMEKFVKFDTEILFAKLTDLAFLEFFKEGLDYFDYKNVFQATTFFNKALIFKPHDFLTKFLVAQMNSEKFKKEKTK
jgi:hypothetical protein